MCLAFRSCLCLCFVISSFLLDNKGFVVIEMKLLRFLCLVLRLFLVVDMKFLNELLTLFYVGLAMFTCESFGDALLLVRIS